MTRNAIIVLLASLPMMANAAAAAEPVPCETQLKKVDAALQSPKLGADVKAKATALRDKGLERCKADDDARADAFFAEALKTMGK